MSDQPCGLTGFGLQEAVASVALWEAAATVAAGGAGAIAAAAAVLETGLKASQASLSQIVVCRLWVWR